jgi:hypothetical protein
MKDIQTYASFGYTIKCQGIRHDGVQVDVSYTYIGIDRPKCIEYAAQQLEFDGIETTQLISQEISNVSVRIPALMKLVDEYSTVVTPYDIEDIDGNHSISVSECQELVAKALE